MNKLLLSLGCCLFAFSAFSQDSLFRTNGSISVVKILKTDAVNIQYRKPGDSSAAVFVLNKMYVDKIVYENGTTEIIDRQQAATAANIFVAKYKEADTLKNMVTLCVSDLFSQMVSVEYDHFFSAGNFSIKIPLSVDIGPVSIDQYYSNSYYANRSFSSGLGCYFHPLNYGSFRYYMGPAIEVGKMKDVDNSYEKYTNKWFVSFLVHAGIAMYVSEHIVVSANAGLGWAKTWYRFSSSYEEGKRSEPFFDLRGGLNIGYKF